MASIVVVQKERLSSLPKRKPSIILLQFKNHRSCFCQKSDHHPPPNTASSSSAARLERRIILIRVLAILAKDRGLLVVGTAGIGIRQHLALRGIALVARQSHTSSLANGLAVTGAYRGKRVGLAKNSQNSHPTQGLSRIGSMVEGEFIHHYRSA